MRWNRSRLVELLTAIVCVALAAVAVEVSDATPEYDDVRGRVRAPVAVEDGEVTVDEVRIGTQLTRTGEVLDTTPGAFVVVRVTGAATGTGPISYSESRLVTRGPRVYRASGSPPSVRAQPGFAAEVDVVFEVDPTQIEDLTLELWELEIIRGYQERVQVHLGITRANAEQWRQLADGQAVEIETNTLTRALS